MATTIVCRSSPAGKNHGGRHRECACCFPDCERLLAMLLAVAVLDKPKLFQQVECAVYG